MTHEAVLRGAFVALEVNGDFSEAVLTMRDDSRLSFRHRVGERWAKATGPDGNEDAPGLAGRVLAAMALFRLNSKHLDVRFQDGSRWEARFRDRPGQADGQRAL